MDVDFVYIANILARVEGTVAEGQNQAVTAEEPDNVGFIISLVTVFNIIVLEYFASQISEEQPNGGASRTSLHEEQNKSGSHYTVLEM